MNIFEKDALELIDEARFGAIVSAWVTFSAHISQLVDCYNRGPRGVRHPAEILTKTDALIVIRCNKGLSKAEDFAHSMITLRSTLERNESVIECTIQRWTMRMGGAIAPGVDSQEGMRFTLRDGSLMLDREIVTPHGAAEKVLGTALLQD